MKKLALDLDALRVESFATEVEPEARGTVRGQQEAQTIERTVCYSCPSTCGMEPAHFHGGRGGHNALEPITGIRCSDCCCA